MVMVGGNTSLWAKDVAEQTKAAKRVIKDVTFIMPIRSPNLGRCQMTIRFQNYNFDAQAIYSLCSAP